MRIIGHQAIRDRLRELALRGAVSQSYAFYGPEGIGKRLVALEFASGLAGEPEFEPSAEKAQPFDVMVLRPETETKRGITKEKSISTESMREAMLFLSRYPAAGKYRVLVVEDAHKLSAGAQNALLKTLEEPSSSSVVIFVTHELGSLIPTILSRVERVRFSFLSEEDLRSGMRELTSLPESLPHFFYSLGRPGILIEAASDPEGFAARQKKLGLLYRLSALSLKERLDLAEGLSGNVPETLRLIEWWLPGLHAQAKKLQGANRIERFFSFLEAVEESRGVLRSTQSNARLVLEKLFLSV